MLGDLKWWNSYFETNGGWEKNRGRVQSKKFAEYFCENIKLEYSKGFSLLDFGCALGDALIVFSENYPNVKLYGCDISKIAIDRCIRELGNIADFFIGDFDSLQQHFTVIYISNVLEHFIDYKDKVRKLIKRCETLCVMVPYNEKRNGKILSPNPTEHHQLTFIENSFDFLKEENLAKDIKTMIVSCPGAWGWTSKRKKIEKLKNIIRPLFGRHVSEEPLQIIFDIKIKSK